MIQIVIIDDHALIRDGIRQLLNHAQEIQIIGEASTGVAGVQLVRERRPTVVLLDLKLPDITGLEVAARLLRLDPASKILTVSAHFHHEFVQRMLKIGVLGYMTKEASQKELIQAIQTVAKGQNFISSSLVTRLALSKIDSNTSTVFNTLTNKEMEVLILCLRGSTARHIAQRLYMSINTVHSYRNHLFKKLGIHNDVGLMMLAVREGLMRIEEVSG